MDFLGIGPLEFLLIFIIILLVLGPNEMIRVGAALGSFIRQVRKSDLWRSFQRMSRTMRNLPEDLARQTGLDKTVKDIKKSAAAEKSALNKVIQESEDALNAWTKMPDKIDSKLSKTGLPTREKKIDKPTKEDEQES
ncbi:MAG: hypothetical protein FVQ83_02300 [Chloroflexi bacterium]|nr:hypothetical protein [Chloroflexota bacterium]